jgi:hypothetical protein
MPNKRAESALAFVGQRYRSSGNRTGHGNVSPLGDRIFVAKPPWALGSEPRLAQATVEGTRTRANTSNEQGKRSEKNPGIRTCRRKEPGKNGGYRRAA